MKDLYKIAAAASKQVYIDNIDTGSVEYKLSFATYQDKPLQVLSFAGTGKELSDWAANFYLLSWKGIKKSSYNAAKKIQKNIFPQLTTSPLLVTGHSLGAAHAIAYKKLFNANYCVAFAPARCLRYWTNREMENTTLFIDPDDPVSKVGFINFGHPVCKVVESENDHVGIKVSDHYMNNWVEFVG